MPLREYSCPQCEKVVEVVELGPHNLPRFCEQCEVPMDPVEYSRPAPVRVGRYGKAGGLAPEAEHD